MKWGKRERESWAENVLLVVFKGLNYIVQHMGLLSSKDPLNSTIIM